MDARVRAQDPPEPGSPDPLLEGATVVVADFHNDSTLSVPVFVVLSRRYGDDRSYAAYRCAPSVGPDGTCGFAWSDLKGPFRRLSVAAAAYEGMGGS